MSRNVIEKVSEKTERRSQNEKNSGQTLKNFLKMKPETRTSKEILLIKTKRN